MAIQNWTIATLTSHLEGQLCIEPNAAGGTVPDRTTNIVTRAYYDVWEAHDWLFRQIRATLTTAAGTATVAFPDDFAKLDMKWVRENNNRGRIRFTQDVDKFEDSLDLQNDTNGIPQLALLEAKTAETTKFVWQCRLFPTPSAVYTYPYVYLRLAPDLAASGIVLWPRPFYRGWELLAHYRMARAFSGTEAWKDIKADYKFWKADAISDYDEAMRADVDDIESNGDEESLRSNCLY